MAVVVVALVALGACSASDQPSSSAASPASPAATLPQCGTAGAAPATGSQSFPFGGQTRQYLLHLPPGYDGVHPAPIVFDFHGFASDATTEDANTDMGAKGSARGYVVVTPTAEPPEWNEFGDPSRPDDYGFVHALLTDLETRLCIDSTRVYAAGHSNGSAFVGLLGCKPQGVFDAIAMVSATIPVTCPDDTGPSVMVVAGTADPQVPYAGGTVNGSTIRIPGAAESVQGWAAHHHCASVPVSDQPLVGVQRDTYTSCAPGTTVVLDTIIDGTHPWPGGLAARNDATDSAAGRLFDATSAILDFFDASVTPTR